MGWRERFGADDERARIAARARALLDAAGTRPSPGEASSEAADVTGAASAVAPLPSPRGGWVPPTWAVNGPDGPGARSDRSADTVDGHTHSAGDLADSAGGRYVDIVGGRTDSAGGRYTADGRYADSAGDLVHSADGRYADTARDRYAGGRHAVPAAASAAGQSVLPAVLRPVELEPDAGYAPPDDRRSWRERVRFDPGRRGLVAVAAVVVVAGSVAGGVVFRGGQSAAVTLAAASGAPAPSAASVAPTAASGGGTDVPSSSSSSPPVESNSPSGTVTVDVAGLVVHPGVYTLPAGSRVEDALREAGGARPGADVSTLNRARVLVDGEQLAVGVPGATAPAAVGSGAPPGAAGAGGVVNLNTAGLAELDTLPGVGPVLAQAILDWRTEHGRFSSVGDLDQVSGIGPSTFAKLKDLVTV